MATDFDTRRAVAEPGTESIEGMQARPADADTIDALDEDVPMVLDATIVDLPDEELLAPVVPQGNDEFCCSRCFLVHHRSQLVSGGPGREICRDCA